MVSNGSNFGVEEAQPKSLSTKSLRVLLYRNREKGRRAVITGIGDSGQPARIFPLPMGCHERARRLLTFGIR